MLEIIKTRRSCRNYLDKSVSIEDIHNIVECGLLAPSGKNNQGIKICVITNKEVLNTLAKLSERDFFYGAPVLIVVYGEIDNEFTPYDGSCAMSQMHLAAHALGLGSCWINHLKRFVNDPKYSEIMTSLGLIDKTIVGALSVGYAADKPKPKVMKDIQRVNYID